MVVPVRETCAQILGIIIKQLNQNLNKLNQNICNSILETLIILQKSNLWEVRLSGFIGMKYFITIKTDFYNISIILFQILQG